MLLSALKVMLRKNNCKQEDQVRSASKEGGGSEWGGGRNGQKNREEGEISAQKVGRREKWPKK